MAGTQVETTPYAEAAAGAAAIVIDALRHPEKRLMLAILEDAVAARRLPGSEAAEVGIWMAAEDPAWPFSFVNVCKALGLDVWAVRRLLSG